jgi:ATP-dependent helicase/nuclease subunit B
MGVQFVIGRAGAGKSKLFLDQTAAACKAEPLGEPIVWLVPRQATFQVERELCCRADLNGYFRVRVVSFELLGRQVLEETGGAAATEISSVGRQMILGHLLRRHKDELRFFRSADSGGPGLTAELDATLIELAGAGADLSELSERLKKTDQHGLVNKIGDLLRIHTAYESFLGENRLDPEARLKQAVQILEHCPFLRNAVVYVDGFLRFSPRERKLLVTIGRLCRQINIALMLDPESDVLKNLHHNSDELELFHRSEEEYQKLYFGFGNEKVKVLPSLILRETPRFQSAAMKQIQTWSDGTEGGSSDGLELIEAPNMRAEADAVARRVRDLAAGGFRYRDIAVLARNLSGYHDLIAAAFGEHGIPCFVDQRRPAGHHPLIQFVRAALAVAVDKWPTSALMTLVKSGLCGLTSADADELENYCLLHGIRGATWSQPTPWTGSGTIGDDDGIQQRASAASADKLRRALVDPLRKYVDAVSAEGKTVGAVCHALFALMEDYQIRQTISRWIAESREAEEHKQVWGELLALFEQLVELLGDQVMKLADFSALLDAALDKFDFAIAPQTVDQVLLGQVDRARLPAVKAAIVVGLSDGIFPMPQPPEKVLSDKDRKTLFQNSVDVEPGRKRRALDEIFLGYFAFTRPSHLLIVTRPLANESGRLLEGSSLWRKLKLLVPGAQVRPVPPDDIATPRQLVTGLMQWARDRKEPSVFSPLYDWFRQRANPVDAVGRLRELAWPALDYANTPVLPPELAAKLFPSPMHVSARRLETFRACPFQHFVRYGLNLAPRGVQGFGQQDVSSLSHDVLERLTRGMIRRKQNWDDVSADDLKELAAESGRRLKGEFMLDAARSRYLLQWITRTLEQVIAAQRAAARRSQFRPTAAGIRYDDGGEIPALRIPIPGGGELLVHGRIDRVDVNENKNAAVVYDYRLSNHSLSLGKVYHGLTLKLLADILAWQSAHPSRPVAALEAAILRPVKEDDPETAPNPGEDSFDLSFKPRGIIDDHFAGDLDSGLAPGNASDVFSLYLTKEATFGKKSTTDIAESTEFALLLEHVRGQLAKIAAEIGSGVVSVSPYRLGNESPCAHCVYADVCRFEKKDQYNWLQAMTRVEVFERLKEERS